MENNKPKKFNKYIGVSILMLVYFISIFIHRQSVNRSDYAYPVAEHFIGFLSEIGLLLIFGTFSILILITLIKSILREFKTFKDD